MADSLKKGQKKVLSSGSREERKNFAEFQKFKLLPRIIMRFVSGARFWNYRTDEWEKIELP
jgi:hypothetical protein